MSLSVEIQELISQAIESRLGDLYTTLPGRVEKYYPATQTADVAPTIKRPIPTREGDIRLEDLPVCPNVPVCFPRGGLISISWKLNKGDHVLLLFSTLSLAQWRKSGKTSAPGDLRMHHLGNALAIPILAPNTGAFSEARADEDALIMVGPMIKLGTEDAEDFAALSSKVDSNFQKVVHAITTAAVATGAADGGAGYKANLTILLQGSDSPEPVACERVKIK